ncbi:helix-turn-helix domain-containing protein [Intestinimonas butyriciproducens]|uniref:helix-turn-helix domain-containing protein n=1 Tax=Intestinimonas butyriciproducens TaxID=1297617 RepID=UPI002430FE33|nr:helix-turn-helix transcriptional regulator [Intestinimonas butyriciproducens]MCI6363818.1 helix-turn-helix domain-containing protein [Intestinimonas butyriciproducens]
MSFYERYEILCKEHDFTPNSPKSFEITGVSTGAVSGWKKGSMPKGDVIRRIATYFDVTTDYLLGLSEVRKPSPSLSEEEMLLLNAYRSATSQGRFRIIQVCMNEQDSAGKGETANVG